MTISRQVFPAADGTLRAAAGTLRAAAGTLRCTERPDFVDPANTFADGTPTSPAYLYRIEV